MIAKLRWRFIRVSMFSVICVLGVILGAINLSVYLRNTERADAVLDLLIEHSGTFPTEAANELPAIHTDWLSQEAPYDTRFFWVVLGRGGETLEVETGNISAISTEQAVDIAHSLASGGHNRGYIDEYRYAVEPVVNGTLVMLLYNGREMAAFRSFYTLSITISGIGILTIFFLVFILSKHAIGPIAESYNKQKNFITDAGHEIKTPLTIIDANAEIIEMEHGESEWTMSIRNQVKRLNKLTDGLLALSRMDHLSQHELRTEFSLSDAVSETADAFQALTKMNNKSIVTDIQQNISYVGDENAIRSLVTILLDNALKYSPEDGEIHLSLQRKGRSVRLVCKNPVAYIERGDHSELFTRFYRRDKSRSRSGGGHGIGLSLAQATVNAHNGRLSAHSEDNHSLTVEAVLYQ